MQRLHRRNTLLEIDRAEALTLEHHSEDPLREVLERLRRLLLREENKLAILSLRGVRVPVDHEPSGLAGQPFRKSTWIANGRGAEHITKRVRVADERAHTS